MASPAPARRLRPGLSLDLRGLQGRRIIAEGVDLLPERVLAVTTPRRAAWLVPSRRFFNDHYAEREWVTHPPDDTTWEPYQRLIEHVTSIAGRNGGLVLEADGRAPPEQVGDVLSAHFAASS